MWDTPDGYPDNMDFWAGTILSRWNFASYVSSQSNAAGEITFDVAPLVALGSPAAITAQIEKMVFGGDMPAALEAQITSYLSAATVTAASREGSGVARAELQRISVVLEKCSR